MRVFTLLGAALFAVVLAPASDPASATPVPPGVAASLFGGACSHNYASVAAGGTAYCDCTGDVIRVKDDGGNYDTKQTTCSTSAKCWYPENENCTGS